MIVTDEQQHLAAIQMVRVTPRPPGASDLRSSNFPLTQNERSALSCAQRAAEGRPFSLVSITYFDILPRPKCCVFSHMDGMVTPSTALLYL